jgi:hypothetical protein
LSLLGAAGAAPASAVEPSRAELYIVHALAGPAADISLDGDPIETGAQPKTIVGPLDVAPGEHVVSFTPEGASPVSASVDVGAGESADVVAHQGADPTSAAILTVFPNDLSAVAPGKARLVVAHTATVPPADIRVNGDVLFSNVANGEALTLEVPGGTYEVDIVPAATDGPVVFGPVDLAVAAEKLNRVYAFGNPEAQSMDAIVRTATLPVEGSGLPGEVQTGDGGQAFTDRTPPAGGLIALSLVVLAGSVVLWAASGRGRSRGRQWGTRTSGG